MRLLCTLALLSTACAMGANTSSSGPLKPVTFDSGPQCLQLCTELGLKMSALVIIEAKTACVCEPPAGGALSPGAAAAAASAAANKQKEEEKKAAPDHNLMQEQQLQEEQNKKPR